jgi:hypothetical protein
MHCPYCEARNDDDSDFCHHCGAYPDIPSVSAPVRKTKGNKKAVRAASAVAVILILAVFSGIFLWTLPSGQTLETDEYVIYGSGSVATGAIQISEYEDGDPFDEICSVTFTCSANTVTGYVWGIRSMDESLHYKSDGYAVDRIHTIPADAVFSPDGRSMSCNLTPGHYSVKVKTNFREYTGTVAFQGKVVRDYSWTFYADNNPTDFDVTLDFDYGECLPGIEYDGKRRLSNTDETYDLIRVFSAPSEITDRLESRLRDAYASKWGPPAENDGRYAQFILTFVQCAFSYPPNQTEKNILINADEFVYGTKEYWAFPSEVIMQGQGDCEDTSFLCSALFKAAGYDTAVVFLPTHAMSGVAVSGILPLSDGNSYVVKQTVAGITYYGCETTTEGQYPIGYTALTYFDSDRTKRPLTYELEPEISSVPTDDLGFFPI